jgi:signal transduction histidine kinase
MSMFKAPVWYLVLLAAATAMAAVPLVQLRRADETTLRRCLQLLMAAVILWTAMTFLDGLGISPPVTYTFTKLTYVGIPLVPTAFLLVALAYTDRGEFVDRRLVALLAVEPVLVNGVVWTNRLHELFWTLDWSQAETPITGHGPLFFAHAVYLWLLTVVGVLVVADVLYRRERWFKLQSVALALSAAVPLVANVAFVAELVPVDPTPPAFVVSGTLFYWAVARTDVTSISPIARQTVVDTMGAAMFVVADGLLVDVNRQGRRLLDVDPEEDVVGEPAADLFADPVLFERFDDVVQGTETLTLEGEGARRHYEVEVSPVVDGGTQVARLFLVQDVTERVDRQRELERKNEQLEGFASVVSHDLRNPLTVAAGYVDTIAEVTDDETVAEYAGEAAAAHDRMETLVDDILTMAREGDTVDDPDAVSLWSVARAAWGTVDTAEMTIEAADDRVREVTVLADRDRLQRLFENCIRNAREHAGRDATVTVGVTGFTEREPVFEPSDRAFWIADDGPGIPPDERDSVLEEGYTTDEDGTGFGLAIVRTIADGHGWTVRVEVSDAGGAKFVFDGVATPGRTTLARAADD